ncbi:MAG: hypothetical protein A2341_16295 [Deltaproteobacteria bacterium RIFOXYB12_FULL_58_9]|nr:MAG: hypothetical protein A2341_16295 [Deltaproteobacteria bacterium RIFOXYB12_FULL_58_9]
MTDSRNFEDPTADKLETQSGDPARSNNSDAPEVETEDFASMLESYGAIESLRVQVGDKVGGKIIHATADTFFVQISPTQEAFILKSELVDAHDKLSLGLGDEIEGFIYTKRGGIELRRKIGGDSIDIVMLEQAKNKQIPIEGTVTGTNKGGLEVAIGGPRGFCPISQADINFVEDAQAMVGQTYEFLIAEVKENGRNVVLNRKALLQAARKEKASTLLAELEVGQRRKVRVTRLAKFGAFADLGGIDGLIPISELSYGNVQSTEDAVKEGDDLEVEIMRIEEDPKRPGQPRIGLSLKAVLPDPFIAHADKLHEGSSFEGKVVRVQKFGAFVELFDGVQGLIHISEMSDRRIRHPRDVVTEGDTVSVRVVSFDPEQRRVGLSMRETPKDVDTSSIRIGARVKGTVERIESYGLFVSLADGGKALLPAAETGTTRGTDLLREFPIGTELELSVIAIDEQGRIKVSKTARDQEEERSVAEAYNRSQSGNGKGFGTLGDLLKIKRNK